MTVQLTIPQLSITNVLGISLPVTHYYGDGSYDCPHCYNAVRADEGFDLTKHNPWCIANPLMSVESARKIVMERESKIADEARRKRDHELAMQRITEYNNTRNAVRTAYLEDARNNGYCIRCIVKTDGKKRIRHRAGCPLEK